MSIFLYHKYIYSKTIAVFSPTPHNLSAHRNTYTQSFILSCSCRHIYIYIYSSLLRLTPFSRFTWFELWDLCLVVPTNADHTVCFKRPRGKRTVRERRKHRQAEFKTGSASSQRAEEEKWVEGGRGGKENKHAQPNTHTDIDIFKHFILKCKNLRLILCYRVRCRW